MRFHPLSAAPRKGRRQPFFPTGSRACDRGGRLVARVVAQREAPTTFERINVSWEYLDAGILYESGSGSAFWSCRAGITATLPFRDSYYSTGPGSVTESPLGPVTRSRNWLDPYAGVQAEWEDLFAIGSSVGWEPYVSAEMRWRSVYEYHRQNPRAAENRPASLNHKSFTMYGIGIQVRR